MSGRVFDSSAILAIVFDEPGAERALEMLDGGLISSVNYSEALAKMLEKGFIEREALDGLVAFTFEIVPFDQSQAERTARLRAPTASKGLGIGDRACLSLAMSRGLAAVTTDRSWSALDIDCEIELLR